MKCPKQTVFIKKLGELLDLSRDLGRDHFSVDEWEKKNDILQDLKNIFINNWCPTLKVYDDFKVGEK